MSNPLRIKDDIPKEVGEVIRGLAIQGWSLEQIRALTKIPLRELKKNYKNYIQTGAVQADAQVYNTLFKMATSGHHPNMTKYWLAARIGLSPESHIRLNDVRDLTAEELNLKIKEMNRTLIGEDDEEKEDYSLEEEKAIKEARLLKHE